MIHKLKTLVQNFYKRYKKARLERPDSVYAAWNRHKISSVHFFSRKFLGGAMQRRLDPQLPLKADIRRYLPDNQSEFHLLDVGAGPVTRMGYVWGKRTIHIEAVDVNAEQYNRMFARHGVTPPVVTRQGEAEKIADMYPANRFDLAYSRNALDHCHNPQAAIQGMVDLVKPGCWVLLRHRRNEGETQGYRGAHLWNFDIEEGEVTVSNPSARYILSRSITGAQVQFRSEVKGNCEWLCIDLCKK